MEIIDALSIIDATVKFSDDCNFKMAVATIRKELAEALKPPHNIAMPKCQCKGWFSVRNIVVQQCGKCGGIINAGTSA